MAPHSETKADDNGTLLLTKSELAEHLRCSERQIDKLTVMGAIPTPIFVGKSRRWSRAVIESWICQQTTQTNV